MKKIIAVLLCFAALAASTTAVCGNQTAGPSFWINTSSVRVSLSFNNDGRGSMSGTVIGDNGVNSIVVDAVLERVNPNGTRSPVVTWSNITSDSDVWFWGTNYYVTEGYTYRFTLYATVTRNGVSETVSGSKSAFAW
jgi:hypothetical protein